MGSDAVTRSTQELDAGIRAIVISTDARFYASIINHIRFFLHAAADGEAAVDPCHVVLVIDCCPA